MITLGWVLAVAILATTGGRTRFAYQDAVEPTVGVVREALSRSKTERNSARARALCAEALRLAAPVESSFELADVLWDVSDRADELHDRLTARDGMAHAAKIFAEILNPDHPKLQGARANLGVLEAQLGNNKRASELLEGVIDVFERTGHPQLLAIRNNLARIHMSTGDLAAARESLELVVAELEDTRDEDDRFLQMARTNLANVLFTLGGLHEALALLSQVIPALERISEPSDFELRRARAIQSSVLARLGDVRAGLANYEELLAEMERTRHEDDPDLHVARMNTGGLRLQIGDLEGGRDLLEIALAGLERLLPENDVTIQRARASLSTALRDSGELEASQLLAERALDSLLKTHSSEHPEVLRVQSSLALTLVARGDFSRARELQETRLSAMKLRLPPHHPEVLLAKSNLASTLARVGDLDGARVLQESVLGGYLEQFGEKHAGVYVARSNLAITLKALGRLEVALALEEKVLEGLQEVHGSDHRRVHTARVNLAGTLMMLGRVATAADYLRVSMRGLEGLLPQDHPDLVRVRGDLAWACFLAGDFSGARDAHARVIKSFEKTLPDWHPDRIRALAALAWTEAVLDEEADLSSLATDFRDCVFSATDHSARLSYRESAASLAFIEYPISLILSLGERGGSAAESMMLIETVRVASSSSGIRRPADSELADVLARAGALRERVAMLSARGSGGEVFDEALSRRDDADRDLRRLLATKGMIPLRVDSRSLADALVEGEACVGFRVYAQYELGTISTGPDRRLFLLAHVLRKDGAVRRVELGPLEPIARLVRRWREAIGSPIDGRGVTVGGERADSGSENLVYELGTRIRELVLDPVLAELDNSKTLHVCVDAILHLVPLHALPLEGPELVGDRYHIVHEISFERLLSADERMDNPSPRLVAFGGVNFDRGDVEEFPQEIAFATTPVRSVHRGEGDTFAPLPGTLNEVEAIGALFQSSFGDKVNLFSGSAATIEAFIALAPTAGILHLATHGYFADESAMSFLDPKSQASWRRTPQERLAGMAPLTLCGLAFAGANDGPDAVGRSPGLLTAEALAGLDLRACNLAVLSACETNVGILRAGQGIQSLQTALHAAGARTAITSLWRVDDVATQELMERFYNYLWAEKMGKAASLWRAMCDLRARGRPVREWGAWVLSGDPE